jgi:hypothetical protein
MAMSCHKNRFAFAVRALIGLLSAIIFGAFYLGTNVIEQEVSAMNRLLSVQELLTVAGQTSSRSLPIETATTLPIATMSEGKLRVVILYYKEISRPGTDKKMYPPHHIMVLDPSSGEIIKFEECKPKDFGIDRKPDQAEMGDGLDPKMPGDEFQTKKRRLLEISPSVWEAFASGSTSVDGKSLATVKEYDEIFKRIAKKPLLPYYHAVATDFFEWLAKVTK